MVTTMSLLKKISAAILSMAILLGIVGCSDVSYAMTINGQSIRAGIYLLYELQAIGEANDEVEAYLEKAGQNKNSIENFDYFAYKVQETDYKIWVVQRTLELCKQHVAVAEKSKELEITLSAEEQSEIDDYVKSSWEYELSNSLNYKTRGDQYEYLGISKISFKDVSENAKLNNKLFDKYYDEKGLTPTDENDIKTYYKDNYGRFQLIPVALRDGLNATITTDAGKKVLKDLADSYLKRIKEGEDFEKVYADYEAYLKEQQEAAQNDSKDTSDTSKNPEIGDSENDPEIGDSDSKVDDKDDDKEEAEPDNEIFLRSDSESPSEEFIKYAFKLKDEEGGVYEDESYYYVIVRKPLMDREDIYLKNRSALLHEIKDEDFEKVLNDIAKDYEIVENQAAMDMYQPDKIRQ